MRKFFLSGFLVLSIANVVFANTKSYCSLNREKITFVKKDAFGNQKTITTTKFDKLTLELIKKPTFQNKEIVMKIWGEIFALNKKSYRYDFNSKQERYIEFYVYTNTLIPINIKKGNLPYKLDLNILNIQNKKSKINVTVSINSIGGLLMQYIFPYQDFELGKDRLLALIAFLTTKNFYFLPRDCGYIEIDKLSIQVLKSLARLILEKDPLAIKIAYFLAKNDFQKVDELLLKNKEISKFFKIAKQHYLDILKEQENVK